MYWYFQQNQCLNIKNHAVYNIHRLVWGSFARGTTAQLPIVPIHNTALRTVTIILIICKVIFNMLRNSENSEYHTYFKNLFIDLGLDHYVQSAIDIEVFRAFYGQSVRQSEFGKVLSKSSLSMYNNCRVSMGKQLYLSEDFNFEASRLKLLASVEDLQHFALECPLYEDIRADILSQIDYVFSSNHMSVKFRELSSYYKLLYMFGDYGYDIGTEMGKELDYLTKLYLVKAFNVRKIVLEN